MPLYVGTHRLGERVGGPLPAGKLRALVQGWVQFNEEEKKRMKTAHGFWQVVCEDAEGSGKHSDWVLARVASMVPGAELAASAALRVEVAAGTPGVQLRNASGRSFAQCCLS